MCSATGRWTMAIRQSEMTNDDILAEICVRDMSVDLVLSLVTACLYMYVNNGYMLAVHCVI